MFCCSIFWNLRKQWFPKDDNFTLVVACPFNVFGFEYAEEIDMDDIEQVTKYVSISSFFMDFWSIIISFVFIIILVKEWKCSKHVKATNLPDWT